MAYSPLTIANYFVKVSNEQSIPITPMKLLKLVYLAHGWSLGLFNKPLIDENIEAWRYGPVIPSVYHAFKHYRSNPITQTVLSHEEPIQPDDKQLLDTVWEKYRSLTALQLSTLTHQRNTPWWRTNKENSRVIESESIKKFYQKLYESLIQKESNTK